MSDILNIKGELKECAMGDYCETERKSDKWKRIHVMETNGDIHFSFFEYVRVAGDDGIIRNYYKRIEHEEWEGSRDEA